MVEENSLQEWHRKLDAALHNWGVILEENDRIVKEIRAASSGN